MKQFFSRRLILAMIFCLLPASTAWTAPVGGEGDRAGMWQVSLTPIFAESKTIQFEGGAQADIDEHSGFELSVGYNYSQQLEIDVDMGSSNSGYTGTRIDANGTPTRFAASMYESHVNLGLSLNLLKARFTPFIRGNLGWTYIDSGIPTGNVDTICWWDPWWGYVCSPYAQTYANTEWHYGADVGLRFDVTRLLFFKLSIGQTYIDLNHSGTEDFTHYRFSVGFKFD